MLQQPPANLQIQQQFETLKQQQQQHSQLTSSASFNCVSGITTTTTTPTKQTQPSTNSANQTNNNQATNSSPAFKSIFKNLRGSLKHQSQNNINENNDSKNVNNLNPPLQPNNLITNLPSLNNSVSANSSSLIRTNSGNTFKNVQAPPLLLTTSVYSINSPNMDRKCSDYSNCISQLQSAAALAKSSFQANAASGSCVVTPRDGYIIKLFLIFNFL